MEELKECYKKIDNLNEVIIALIQGRDVVQVHSDYWVKRQDNGSYIEMTVDEQIEYSRDKI